MKEIILPGILEMLENEIELLLSHFHTVMKCKYEI